MSVSLRKGHSDIHFRGCYIVELAPPKNSLLPRTLMDYVKYLNDPEHWTLLHSRSSLTDGSYVTNSYEQCLSMPV
jgi:hypothetical protein